MQAVSYIKKGLRSIAGSPLERYRKACKKTTDSFHKVAEQTNGEA